MFYCPVTVSRYHTDPNEISLFLLSELHNQGMLLKKQIIY